MNITKTIKIELTKKEVYHIAASAVSGEVGSRSVCFALHENGVPWQIPATCMPTLAFRTCDGSRGEYDTLPNGAAAITWEENRVTIKLIDQIMAKPGLVELSLVLRDQDLNRAETFPVLMQVLPGLGDGPQLPEQYYQVSTLAGLNEQLEMLASEKGDDLALDAQQNRLYLTSGGEKLGSGVPLTATQGNQVPELVELDFVSAGVAPVEIQDGVGEVRYSADGEDAAPEILTAFPGEIDTKRLILSIPVLGAGGLEETVSFLLLDLGKQEAEGETYYVLSGMGYGPNRCRYLGQLMLVYVQGEAVFASVRVDDMNLANQGPAVYNSIDMEALGHGTLTFVLNNLYANRFEDDATTEAFCEALAKGPVAANNVKFRIDTAESDVLRLTFSVPMKTVHDINGYHIENTYAECVAMPIIGGERYTLIVSLKVYSRQPDNVKMVDFFVNPLRYGMPHPRAVAAVDDIPYVQEVDDDGAITKMGLVSFENMLSALHTAMPRANNAVPGLVQPVSKTADMTQSVGVDGNGALWTAPASAAGGTWNDLGIAYAKGNLLFEGTLTPAADGPVSVAQVAAAGDPSTKVIFPAGSLYVIELDGVEHVRSCATYESYGALIIGNPWIFSNALPDSGEDYCVAQFNEGYFAIASMAQAEHFKIYAASVMKQIDPAFIFGLSGTAVHSTEVAQS